MKAESRLSDQLTVFLFFLFGALISFLGPVSIPGSLPPRLLFSGILGAVLLFSASFYGVFLLPCCALASGMIAERYAISWMESFSGALCDLRVLICSAILIPVLFLCTVHGMYVSGSIHAAVSGGSPSARSMLRNEYFAVLFFSVIGFAAIFYFT